MKKYMMKQFLIPMYAFHLSAGICMPAFAEEFEQTYESCSLVFESNLQYMEMYLKQVPIEKVVALDMSLHTNPYNAELTYKLMKDIGQKKTYFTVGSAFVNCLKTVKDYETKLRTDPYGRCIYNFTLNQGTLMNIDSNLPIDQIKAKLPSSEQSRVDLLSKMVKENGMESVQMTLGEGYHSCAAAVRASASAATKK